MNTMDIEKIIKPDIRGRKVIYRDCLPEGDVVAFATSHKGKLRTGLAALATDSNSWLIWAVNLYKEDGREWVCDSLPSDDIIFFEATKEEKTYATLKAIRVIFNCIDSCEDEDKLIEGRKYVDKALKLLNN